MEYRPYFLAREWVRLGHSVSIAASSYSHLRMSNPAVTKRITEEMIDGIRYIWLKCPVYKRNGVSRMLNMYGFYFGLKKHAETLAGMVNPDIIIASSTYPMDTYPAQKMRKLSGAKLVHEVHDLWPLSLIEVSGASPKNPFIKMLGRAEDSAYTNSDYVVSFFINGFEYMKNHGLTADRLLYIPNGVDVNAWESNAETVPDEYSGLLSGLKSDGWFLLGYAGGHTVSNALDILLDASEKLRDKKIKIILVGKGSEKDRLVKKAAERGLENIIFLDEVKNAYVKNLLGYFDALYIGWNPLPLYRFGICANKLFDYMMSGKPIVHAFDYDSDPVSIAGCGITVPSGDIDGIAAAIEGVLGLPPDERKSMGEKGIAYVKENHSYEKLAEKLIDSVEL